MFGRDTKITTTIVDKLCLNKQVQEFNHNGWIMDKINDFNHDRVVARYVYLGRDVELKITDQQKKIDDFFASKLRKEQEKIERKFKDEISRYTRK